MEKLVEIHRFKEELPLIKREMNSFISFYKDRMITAIDKKKMELKASLTGISVYLPRSCFYLTYCPFLSAPNLEAVNPSYAPIVYNESHLNWELTPPPTHTHTHTHKHTHTRTHPLSLRLKESFHFEVRASTIPYLVSLVHFFVEFKYFGLACLLLTISLIDCRVYFNGLPCCNETLINYFLLTVVILLVPSSC